MRPPWKSAIRVRLTLLYAGAFFLAGLLVVAGLYLYFGHSLRTYMPQHLPPGISEAVSAQAQHEHAATMRAVLNASLVALGAVAIAAAGFGWLLAGRALRPLQDITATARRVAGRNLHERISLQGPADELKDLADTFDAMLERLDRAFDSQRRFVANASHELRTPLTINRALIEVALDDPDANEPMRRLGANLLIVNQRHARLIDGLLALAGSEEQLGIREPVDLADVAALAIAESQPTATQAGVRIHTTLTPALVAGDPLLLQRLAHNLLDNAIRYNLPDDGWVHISTTADSTSAILTMHNSGPAVAPQDIPTLFEPFRRAANGDRHATNGTGGAGLGLSIVRSIAQAHGGHIDAEPGPAGGLAIRVQFPRPPDDTAEAL